MPTDDLTLRLRAIGARAAAREVDRTTGSMRRLGSQTDRAGQAARRSQRSFGLMNKGLGSVAKRAMSTGAAFVGAYASISGAKNAINTTMDLGKTTLALNKNLGMSVEQSSRWAAVARSRNIETKALNMSFGALSRAVVTANQETDKYQQKLDSLGNSEKDREKRMELMQKGAGRASAMFQRLGVSQDVLRSNDFDQQIKAVSDGLEALPAGAERTNISMRLLGRGWQTLGPLFRGGSKAMQEQLDLADKYGVTLKGQTVESIGDLIAAQREQKFATMGLQVAMGQVLIPMLTRAAQKVNQFILQFREGKGAGGEFRTELMSVINPLISIAGWVQRNATLVLSLAAAFYGGVAALKAFMFIQRVMAAMRLALIVLTMWRMGTISMTASQMALNGALLANPIGLIIVAIAALAAAFVVAWKRSETFRKIVTGVFNAVRQVVATTFDVITFGVRQMLTGIGKLAGVAKKVPGLGFLGGVEKGALGAAGALSDASAWIRGSNEPDQPGRRGSHTQPPPTAMGNKARGGPIERTGVYEVGERGRERVHLPRGSVVEPYGGFDRDVVINLTTLLDGKVVAKSTHRQGMKKAATR